MDYRIAAVRRMIEGAPGQRWRMSALSEAVHLSENRLPPRNVPLQARGDQLHSLPLSLKSGGEPSC